MSINRREPVGNTCPDIDKLIKRYDSIMKIIKGYNQIEDVDTLKDIISDVENELYNFDSVLEDLRSANSALRDWGNDCISAYDEMESEKDNEITYLLKQLDQ